MPPRSGTGTNMIPLTLDEVVRAIDGRVNDKLTPVTVTGVSVDSRTCQGGDLFFALRGPRFDGHDFVGAALERRALAAVVHREFDSDAGPLIRVDDTLSALGQLAAFHRQQRSRAVIAVTGSNGKTTTKGMIDHVLSHHLRGRAANRSFNNAVGVPLTLLSAEQGDDYLVVEIGSNAPGEVGYLAAIASPTIGVVTTIGEAHLEGFGSVDGVAAEKLSLFAHVRPGGLAVVNADLSDPAHVCPQRDDVTWIRFGCGESADVRVTDIRTGLDTTECTLNGRYRLRLPMAGAHSALNAAAAFTVCRRLHIEAEGIIEALESFRPPPMRLHVSRVGDLTLIDDSYNANPGSAEAAIDALRHANAKRRVFVAGDMLELGPEAASLHERVGRAIAQAGVEVIVGVGEHAHALVGGALGAAPSVTTLMYSDTESACGDLPRRLSSTDAVLIKGSRRLGLDRLVERVRAAFA